MPSLETRAPNTSRGALRPTDGVGDYGEGIRAGNTTSSAIIQDGKQVDVRGAGSVKALSVGTCRM